jgi:uncharacterized protein (DUF1330 family)
MAAYYVALGREVPDDWYELMRRYREEVEATMARFGGFYRTYLRHRVEVVEGDFGSFYGPTVVEFPSWEQLWEWYHSEEYAPLKALRHRHNRFDVMLIDGLTDEEIAENQRLVSLGEKGVP